jgi:5-methylcytosine-specific restriction enzyme A
MEREFFQLNPEDTDPARIKRERDEARALRKTPWWQRKVSQGICEYCGKKVGAALLTMDHVVPLARGGRSTKSNLVPACNDCNQSKSLETPADRLINELRLGENDRKL